ncbi:MULTISPECIES: ABC-2 family transporter protein [Catenuloplanes]|uniref:ABC-type uncharacterized transport system permease subunit n=1 Tax=Catenuloplanes niger TaxID=587534 RepID=A0AAE3ZP22_9ACTN|nr:ABC-2 family transporter protein [Catenuloplanes niger]MDR7322175.1 ABC-type uncharacterized transport system permease subunit [Catenuloplanes niger]
MAINHMGTPARYPLRLYGVAVRGMLSLVVPFAFTAFFPVSWHLDPDRSRWTALVTPVVAGACVVVGVRIYHRGVRRYENAGHWTRFEAGAKPATLSQMSISRTATRRERW